MAKIERVIEVFECLLDIDKPCEDTCSYNLGDCMCDTTRLYKETVELLKEQQPRILRLPEALGVYDPIVAEFKNPNGKTFIKWVDAVISQDLKSVDITDLYCNEPEGRKLSFSFNLYNTMFRFWSVKPTEKQRKEEPWNGDFRYL